MVELAAPSLWQGAACPSGILLGAGGSSMTKQVAQAALHDGSSRSRSTGMQSKNSLVTRLSKEERMASNLQLRLDGMMPYDNLPLGLGPRQPDLQLLHVCLP